MLDNLRKRAFVGLASVWALTAASAAFAQTAANPRLALVIGNAAYPDQALATTANDAGLIAQTLQAAGFDVVGARDLDQRSLQTALRDFLDKAAAVGPDMQAFVYFAGRAQQYNGDNYFLPVDAKIARDGDLPLAAIRISDIAHALAGIPGRARILVIDGARSNPYVASNPSIAPGLALEAPEPGELIAFDASPGALAGDEEGPYGVYGKTLAGALRQGGVDIAAVFDQTRVLVNQQTQGAVIPWSQSNLGAPYYVFERAADAPPPPAPAIAAAPVAGGNADVAYYSALQRDTIPGYSEFLRVYPKSDQARRVRAILAARREASLWERTVATNSPRAYWTYVRLYPKGPHIGDARRRIAMLAAAYDPPPDFRPMVYDDLPPPPPGEIEHFDRSDYAFDDYGPPPPPPPPVYYQGYDDDWRDLPPPPPPREVGLLPVLGIAIPAIVGAIAYQNRGRDDGVAPAGAAPPRMRPPAPPALPPNVHPVAAAAPTPTPTPTAGGAGRPVRPGFNEPRPLPPIAQPANPPAGKPRPAGPQPTPSGTPTPPAVKPTLAPLPTPSGAPTPPAAKPTPAPLPTPSGTSTPPAEKPKPVPLPTPSGTPTPSAVKPPPAPLPTPTATATPPAVKPTPAPLPTPSGTPTPPAEKPKPAPLPTPTGSPTPPAAKPTAAPQPTPSAAPTPHVEKPKPAAPPPPAEAPTPHVEIPKPAAPPPPPAVHAAPPPPPAAAKAPPPKAECGKSGEPACVK